MVVISSLLCYNYIVYLTRDTDIAWAAGFFDGEGCISFRDGKCREIKWSQKDIKPLIQLDLIFNTGSINRAKTDKYIMHEYHIFGREAIRVLKLILPYLNVKRDKAIVAIQTEPLIRKKSPNRIK